MEDISLGNCKMKHLLNFPFTQTILIMQKLIQHTTLQKLDFGIVKTRENYKLACQRTFPEVLFWVGQLFRNKICCLSLPIFFASKFLSGLFDQTKTKKVVDCAASLTIQTENRIPMIRKTFFNQQIYIQFIEENITYPILYLF